MPDAFTTAIASMQNDMNRMETISLNMANISTPGYRRAIPSMGPFDDVMRASAAALDLTTGPMKATGKAYDLALVGEGYFEVQAEDGPAYTRAGSFRLDPAGRLVTQAGQAVGGTTGDIVLNGAVSLIDSHGLVSQNGKPVGQIKVVAFPAKTVMVKLANGLLRPASPEHQPEIGKSPMRVGFLEGSNVQPAKESVNLMETTRRLEASQKLFQGYDEVMRSALQSLGQ